ncbi:heterokaryon incompatibility protein-domain-containing protein [Cerioporus squamosus]|nr:heterokaryon incompatibility protein-domain-containing protein [Cerioporus squamosus]
MRVLDTHTGEFFWLDEPETSIYAIVSHVWSPRGEQSYQELVEIQKDVKKKIRSQSLASTVPVKDTLWTRILNRLWPQSMRTVPSTDPPSVSIDAPYTVLSDPRVSDKVRNACAFARDRGYRYLWLDSCCIDKSSSAELSEAINSMYGWYASAEICLVYLADVDHDDQPRSEVSQFRKSKWHTRGWTLQEMIAPVHVLFLSRDWRVLGSKTSLEDLIENVTGVEREVLNHTKELGAEEGAIAFMRLQEEILRTIPDQSISAWGPSLEDAWDDRPGFGRPVETRRAGSSLPRYEPSSLLATTPTCFWSSRVLRSIPQHELVARISVSPQQFLYECTVTSSGVRVRLPLLESSSNRIAVRSTSGVVRTIHAPRLTILACVDDRNYLVALPLSLRYTSDYGVHSVHQNLYEVSLGSGVLFPNQWWSMPDHYYRNSSTSDKPIVAQVLIQQISHRKTVTMRPIPATSLTDIDIISMTAWGYKLHQSSHHMTSAFMYPRLPAAPAFKFHMMVESDLEVFSFSIDEDGLVHGKHAYWHIPAFTHLYKFSGNPLTPSQVRKDGGTSLACGPAWDNRYYAKGVRSHVDFALPPPPSSGPQRPAAIRLGVSRRLRHTNGGLYDVKIYTIDFVGPSAGVTNGSQSVAKSQPQPRSVLVPKPRRQSEDSTSPRPPLHLTSTQAETYPTRTHPLRPSSSTPPTDDESHLDLERVVGSCPMNDYAALLPGTDGTFPIGATYFL